MGGVGSKGQRGGGSGAAVGPPVPPHRAGGGGKDVGALLAEVLSAAIATGFLVWGLKLTLSHMDPYKEQRREAKRQAAILTKRLGRAIELNEFEMLLASNVLNPRAIDVSLDDIGGLEHVKEEMRFKVLRPLSEPDTFCTTLWRPVKGVLFYGPPGTGKTMLAKALAAESRCFFINVTASAVMSKWYGDANRFIRAIFTLASKLEPAVIFIDEVDAFLTKRGASTEHEATLQAKTEFLQLWDGMEGARGARVVVMGATNRPWMVDEAVLRRFALQYEIGLPTHAERAAILRRYLLRHEADMEALRRAGRLRDGEGGVDLALLVNRPPPGAPPGAAGALDAVAAAAAGYSGSDLMELASQAAQNVLVEHYARVQEQQLRQAQQAQGQGAAAAEQRRQQQGQGQLLPLRQLRAADLVQAMELVRPGTSKAQEYSGGVHGSATFDAGGGGGGGGMAQLLAAAAAAAAASSGKRGGGSGGNGGASAAAGARGANGSRSSVDGGAAAADGGGAGAGAAAAGDGQQQQQPSEEFYAMIGKLVVSTMGATM